MGSPQVYDKAELEYRVNKYTLRCLTFMLLCMGIAWVANICNFFIVNQELMAWGASLSAGTALATLLFAQVVDLHKSWVKYVLLFNVILAITIAGTALTYNTVLLSVVPLLIATQYINKKMLAYSYVLTILSLVGMVMVGYEKGLCDANMLLLTTEPTQYYLNQLTAGQFTDSWNTNPVVPLLLFFVLPRSVILLLLLPIIRSISENTMGYATHAAEMKVRSETDKMTGLYNKNKYLEMIKQYYPGVKEVGVIFWDVNGLKETNDKLGHEKGDFLIKIVSDCIKKLVDSRRKGYRIGGDEFVLIVENPLPDELEQIFARWDNMIRLCNQVSDIKCSVAKGYEIGAGKDIEKVAKAADQKMYENKASMKG